MQNLTLKDKLNKAGIKNFDVLIHDQQKKWLLENFEEGKKTYPVNVAALMRNIIWQIHSRIKNQEKEPLTELIRTFWYMYIKPTLSRAGALSNETDQYKQLIDNMVYMVKDLELLKYKDIGFRDDKESHRKVGGNSNIILFSEKAGHQNFLDEISKKYDVSILALGGQPSVLNVEYFVDDLKVHNVNLRRSFYLFSIVDYDPSGWIIRDAFINDLIFYGVKNIKCYDLVNPDMLTIEELLLAKYLIPTPEEMKSKNEDWLLEVRSAEYQHQAFLEETQKNKKILYGLEAESISSKRLSKKLEEVMVPLLGKSEDLLKTFELKKLNDSIKKLILYKLTR